MVDNERYCQDNGQIHGASLTNEENSDGQTVHFNPRSNLSKDKRENPSSAEVKLSTGNESPGSTDSAISSPASDSALASPCADEELTIGNNCNYTATLLYHSRF